MLAESDIFLITTPLATEVVDGVFIKLDNGTYPVLLRVNVAITVGWVIGIDNIAI
jgi:hypothetical protein